jgi:hypothetical protein
MLKNEVNKYEIRDSIEFFRYSIRNLPVNDCRTKQHNGLSARCAKYAAGQEFAQLTQRLLHGLIVDDGQLLGERHDHSAYHAIISAIYAFT